MRQGYFLNRRTQKCLTRFILMGVIGGLSGIVGCVPSKVQVQAAPQFDPSTISSIAILPFQALQVPQWGYGEIRESVRDPEEIRSQFRLPGADHPLPYKQTQDLYSVSDTAAKFIATLIETRLRARQDLQVIGVNATGFAGSSTKDVSGDSLRLLAKEAGNRLNVDGVLMGMVRTYREREGSRMGAKPAAVGFEVLLVKPSDGMLLWKGEFFEEQKPLTQDVVGFFEKSGGFVTARELSEIGVKKVLEKFPVGRDVSPH